ncbi:MAG: 54S ribosomal protein L11, mitochondrial [Marteilia pararefringens]
MPATSSKKALKIGTASSGVYKCYIPAARATSAPPLGPSLSERGIPLNAFLKDFNKRTEIYHPGTVLPTTIEYFANKTWKISFTKPAVSWYMMQAAGLSRASHYPGKEQIGWLSVKHIYMIAKEKSTDPQFESFTLKEICFRFIHAAKYYGIKVSHHIDKEEFLDFCRERDQKMKQQDDEYMEMQASKYVKK